MFTTVHNDKCEGGWLGEIGFVYLQGKIKVMKVLDSFDSLIKKYHDGDITLDQYYSGLADLSFIKSHPGATYNGKQITIK